MAKLIHPVKKQENYVMFVTDDGIKAVSIDSVEPFVTVTGGNDKTGNTITVSLPIAQTCDKNAECRKQHECYACNGAYIFGQNIAKQVATLKAFIEDSDKFKEAVEAVISENSKFDLFRHFGSGDFPSMEYIDVAVAIANDFPQMEFYGYTKKYDMLDAWLSFHGVHDIREIAPNLCFSESTWTTQDGAVLTPPNPHNLPTTIFIPVNHMEIMKQCKYICPCGFVTDKKTCDECRLCAHLKQGETLGFLEHSTPNSKAYKGDLKADAIKMWNETHKH